VGHRQRFPESWQQWRRDSGGRRGEADFDCGGTSAVSSAEACSPGLNVGTYSVTVCTGIKTYTDVV
jgi:hypothetical protein